MARLTDYSRYADAQRFFSKERLCNLFEGDRDALNITHECLDRHRGKGLTIQIALADGGAEKLSLEQVSDAANRIANWTQANRIAPGARVALMLEPSLAFYATLFGGDLKLLSMEGHGTDCYVYISRIEDNVLPT